MVTEGIIICPKCGGKLKHKDNVKRIIRDKGRVTRWIKIERLRCQSCGSIHRSLPIYILPYKQYSFEIIQGVRDGLITCETLGYEDYPCEMTMSRWMACA